MVNVTVSVPEDLKRKMDEAALINWSEVARRAFREQIEDLELLKKITAKSKATDSDIEQLSKKIKHGIATRHGL